jgi:hypothetical protein
MSRVIRPFIAGVALLSGLKYVGLPIPELGVAAIAIFAAVLAVTVRNHRADRLGAVELDETLLAANS